jgi:hypothetical protein
MTLLLLAAFLTPAYAGVPPVPKEVIYTNTTKGAGMAFTLKTTNQPHKYYWYASTDRCLATVRRKTVTVQCKGDPDVVMQQDGTDVVATGLEDDITLTEGMLFHAMYWALINHDSGL